MSWLVVLAFVLAAAEVSAEEPACTLTASAAYVSEPPPTVQAAAVYVTLANDCDRPLTVIGASGPPELEFSVHRTVSNAGVARMEPVSELQLTPKERIEFKPGGLHVMVRGGRFRSGDRLAFNLLVANAPPTPVTAEVRSLRDTTAGHAHAHH